VASQHLVVVQPTDTSAVAVPEDVKDVERRIALSCTGQQDVRLKSKVRVGEGVTSPPSLIEADRATIPTRVPAGRPCSSVVPSGVCVCVTGCVCVSDIALPTKPEFSHRYRSRRVLTAAERAPLLLPYPVVAWLC
jgi:hypothetical protein